MIKAGFRVLIREIVDRKRRVDVDKTYHSTITQAGRELRKTLDYLKKQLKKREFIGEVMEVDVLYCGICGRVYGASGDEKAKCLRCEKIKGEDENGM